MATTLLHNIGRKKRPFNRTLTVEYLKNRIYRHLHSFLESTLDKIVEKVIFQLDDTAASLTTVYKEANEASVEEAKEAYPKIQDLRKAITKQKKRFAEIDYAGSEEVRIKFHKLVRLINRLEARVQRRMYQDVDPEPAPAHIKEKMKSNSRKMIEHAL